MSQQPGTRFRRLQVEALESREVLAVYLPDAFVHERSQPVAAAYNGGEQLLFTAASGKLQFGYGQESNLACRRTNPCGVTPSDQRFRP